MNYKNIVTGLFSLKKALEGFIYAILISLIIISFLGTSGPVLRYVLV